MGCYILHSAPFLLAELPVLYIAVAGACSSIWAVACCPCCPCASQHILLLPNLSAFLQAGSAPGSATPQKIIEAARGASFNEVLARCLSLGSESASPGSKKAVAGDEQMIAPFIPIDANSLGELPFRLFARLHVSHWRGCAFLCRSRGCMFTRALRLNNRGASLRAWIAECSCVMVVIPNLEYCSQHHNSRTPQNA